MEETFMTSQLITQLNNMMKSEIYQQGRLMITRLIVSRKQKALDADSRAIQQIIFTGKRKAEVANTRVSIYYILEQSKQTTLLFSKGTTKVL